MQTFRVVKEPNGWAVRLGRTLCTPFWKEALAIREAERLCASLRCHGVAAEVVIEPETQGSDKLAGGSEEFQKIIDLRRAWR